MGDTLIWNGGKCWFFSLPFSLSLSHLHTRTHSLSLSRSYLSIFGCMLLLFLSPLLFLFHSSPDGSSHSNLRTSDLSSSNFFSCHCLSNEQKTSLASTSAFLGRRSINYDSSHTIGRSWLLPCVCRLPSSPAQLEHLYYLLTLRSIDDD